MSKQKELLYSIITAAPRHLTAEDIYALARRQMPSLALGTVYRNLGILMAEGKIGCLQIPGSPLRYDRNSTPHPHLICRGCGQISDLTISHEQFETLIAPYHIHCTGFNLELYYTCPACEAAGQ